MPVCGRQEDPYREAATSSHLSPVDRFTVTRLCPPQPTTQGLAQPQWPQQRMHPGRGTEESLPAGPSLPLLVVTGRGPLLAPALSTSWAWVRILSRGGGGGSGCTQPNGPSVCTHRPADTDWTQGTLGESPSSTSGSHSACCLYGRPYSRLGPCDL